MKNLWVCVIAVIGVVGAAASWAEETTGQAGDAAGQESGAAVQEGVVAEQDGVAADEEGAAADAENASAEADGSVEVAGDFAVGEKIYAGVCKNCHGRTAKGMASFPKLVDQSAEYLVMRLEAYRAGEKVGPNTPLMAPLATNLSDEEIASLALYITTAFE